MPFRAYHFYSNKHWVVHIWQFKERFIIPWIIGLKFIGAFNPYGIVERVAVLINIMQIKLSLRISLSERYLIYTLFTCYLLYGMQFSLSHKPYESCEISFCKTSMNLGLVYNYSVFFFRTMPHTYITHIFRSIYKVVSAMLVLVDGAAVPYTAAAQPGAIGYFIYAIRT